MIAALDAPKIFALVVEPNGQPEAARRPEMPITTRGAITPVPRVSVRGT
jgi:hypothetical protein